MMLKKLYNNLPNIFIAIITILYILLALLRHYHFMTYGYDLGIYDQQVWLYSQFQNPFITIEYKSALLNHFSPSLALFAPLYWIWNNPQVLLIVQALMVGLSAIPLDILAKRKQFPIYLRTMLIISYLLFYGYQFAINYDVHSVVFGTALIPWLLLCLEDRKYKKAAALLLIILGMKESFPITITLVGIVYFLKGRRRLGAALVAISLSFLFLALKVIQPIIEHFTHESYRFSSSYPHSIQDAFMQLINSPKKLEVWRLSFLWYAFIPLAAPITVIAAIGDIAFYFILGNNHPETLSIYMHYRSSLAPLLAWATIDGCTNIHSKFTQNKKYIYPVITLMLFSSFCFIQYSYHLPLNSLSKPYLYQFNNDINDKNELLKKVPPNIPIAAQNNLIPRLSARKEIHLLWPYKERNGYLRFPICKPALIEAMQGLNHNRKKLNDTCTEPKISSPCGAERCFILQFHENADYLVTDVTPGQNAVELLMENEHKLKEGLTNLEKTGMITLQVQVGDAQLWKVNRY